MRDRLHLSKEHTGSVVEAHKLQLGSPPKWNFQTRIGTGGFAKVYKESITRPVTGKHVCAVKRILKGDVKFPRKLYEREIKIFSKLNQVSTLLLGRCIWWLWVTRPLCIRYSSALANLSRICFQNDWFVQYFDSYKDAQNIYIVMEYMEWGDLVPYIRDRWDASDAAIVTHQLLCGLQYLH